LEYLPHLNARLRREIFIKRADFSALRRVKTKLANWNTCWASRGPML
jgi:hypothetical protein